MSSVRVKCVAVGAGLAVLANVVTGLEVPLTVSEPVGVERKGEVVSGGIPLPEGKYKDGASFSLYNDGKELPVQVAPMLKYADGSMHWALVSFPVELGAKAKKTYVLKDAAGSAKPAQPVVVKENGDIVEVSNGLVAFAVNKANFNGFEWIKFKDKDVFKAAKAGLVANGAGGPGKPVDFNFYYRGPVRTTIYVKGRYGELKTPTFAMAITLNAGESAIHIAHNIRNASVNAPKTTITAPDIRLGVCGALNAGEGGVGKGKQPAFGWQNFSGAADVLVFLQHGGNVNKGYYKAEVAGEELAIHLSPAEGAFDLADGAHKATDLSIVFGKSMDHTALSGELHALADCDYLSANDGFGVGKGWGSLKDETETYRKAGLKNADDPKKFPSMRADPDLYISWFDAHATSECDHLQGMVFGYVRTGNRGFFDQSKAWARYWRTYLLWRSDEFIYGKEGKWNTPKWGSGRCCTEGCHFYGVGIFNYALITGDIDALEAAYDWAEMAGVAWYGPYAGKKPGDANNAYGTRGFARSYLAVARAYDVARDKQRLDLLIHYVNMAVKSPGRDQRGFTTAQSGSGVGAAAGKIKDKAGLDKILQEEGIVNSGRNAKHPKYGEYMPLCVSSWPEAMESMANYMAYEALKDSPDPVAQLAADDALDYCIAQAYLGINYVYNEKANCCYYYMGLDYPRPDDSNGDASDSWYTKWWPNSVAYGYKLTGEKVFLEKMNQFLWWGLARDYVNPPRIPQGEAPTYSRVETNTKGDWMTPTAFAFGIGAHPKAQETPPAAIADLKAVSSGAGKIDLSWSAPKAAAGSKLMRYQVKWSTKPICNYLPRGDEYRKHMVNGTTDVMYWNMARNVVGEPVPAAEGAAEKMSLAVPAGKLYVAVRTYDTEHNLSKLSNIAEVEVK